MDGKIRKTRLKWSQIHSKLASLTLTLTSDLGPWDGIRISHPRILLLRRRRKSEGVGLVGQDSGASGRRRWSFALPEDAPGGEQMTMTMGRQGRRPQVPPSQQSEN